MNWVIVQSVLQHLGVDQANFLNPFEEHQEGKQEGEEKSPRTENSSSHNMDCGQTKKKVSFQNKIKVILVPTVAEYHRAGCDLWWGEADYAAMRESFRAEIETALREDSSLQNNIYMAMTKLYQPDEVEIGCEDPGVLSHRSSVNYTRKLGESAECAVGKTEPFDTPKEDKTRLDSGNQAKHSISSASTHIKRKEAVFVH